MNEQPVLIAAVHGTRDGRDRPIVEALLAQVKALRPGLRARAAYLQFAAPSVSSALVQSGGRAVVVPLLLSTGYHLRADLPAALYAARAAVGTDAEFTLAPALGPHQLLVEALLDRLHRASWRPGTPIVLAAAGSTDARAIVDVRAMARLLAERTRVQVAVGFAAGSSPSVADSVARLRGTNGGPVAVASYLIAPGQFHDLAAASGAQAVAGPIADHPALARLVLHRYDAAVPASQELLIVP
jgi:sirohydrochlorin ferrochelatase